MDACPAVFCVQERAEAKALFRKGEMKKGGATFVPGEALEKAEKEKGKEGEAEQEREGEAREAAAEEERKTGPTPEQLTAIKVCALQLLRLATMYQALDTRLKFLAQYNIM